MTDANNAHMIQARIIWRLYEEYHDYHPEKVMRYSSGRDILNHQSIMLNKLRYIDILTTFVAVELKNRFNVYGCSKDKKEIKM